MTHFEEVGIVQDNPFDRICNFALEYARCKMFSSVRYHDKRLPETFQCSRTSDDVWLEKINAEYDKLEQLNDDEIAELRNTSYISSNYRNFNDKLNFDILDMEKLFKTAWSYSVPVHTDEFDELIHGKDSDFLKTKHRRIDIYNQFPEDFDWSLFGDMADYLNDGDKSAFESYDELEELFKYYLTFIQKFNLSADDVDFLWHYNMEVNENDAEV